MAILQNALVALDSNDKMKGLIYGFNFAQILVNFLINHDKVQHL